MNTTVYTHYEKTIIDNIDFDAYGISNDCYLYDKIKTLYNIFKREYVHQNNQHLSELHLFAEWLKGLPSVLSVPFYYDEIIENAMTYVKENNDKGLRAKIKDEEKFCNDYWSNLAKAFFTLKDNL